MDGSFGAAPVFSLFARVRAGCEGQSFQGLPMTEGGSVSVVKNEGFPCQGVQDLVWRQHDVACYEVCSAGGN